MPALRLRCALLLIAALCAVQTLADEKPPEYRVKAAFIYKFATYIHWPPGASGEVSGPFVIGVFGDDPFGAALDDVVHGQNIQGRPILIRRLHDLEEAIHCEVLFVSSSERGKLDRIFEVLRHAPVLTIGDMDHFAELGGMINLVTTESNQIRFDINKRAVDRAGLKASSELLHLARIVESGPDSL